MKKLRIYAKAVIFIIRRLNIYPLRFFQKKIPSYIANDNSKKLKLKCLKEINDNGISCIDLFDIISKYEIHNLYKYIEFTKRGIGKIQTKSYIKDYVGGDIDSGKILHFPDDDPLLKLALNNFFLYLIKSYLKQDCYLIDITLSETFSQNQEKRIQSQRWHRDPSVRGLIKVFIYFSDTTKECGPFEFINQTHNKMNKYPNKGPIPTKRFGGSFYPDQINLNQQIIKEKFFINSIIGKKGKVIIADTTGLHRGGFCESGSRLMSTFTYYPKGDPWGSRIRVKKTSNTLSEFQLSFIP
tara:strand:+ start:34 stop:924 length:891 start_codon:yes stop_codon:yes gene_type:complete